MGEWTEVKIPFSRFAGTWRGMELPDKIFDSAKIRRIGLQLAGKNQGPFELHVDWIRTYGVGDTPATERIETHCCVAVAAPLDHRA